MLLLALLVLLLLSLLLLLFLSSLCGVKSLFRASLKILLWEIDGGGMMVVVDGLAVDGWRRRMERRNEPFCLNVVPVEEMVGLCMKSSVFSSLVGWVVVDGGMGGGGDKGVDALVDGKMDELLMERRMTEPKLVPTKRQACLVAPFL